MKSRTPAAMLVYGAGLCLLVLCGSCLGSSYYRITMAYAPQKTLPGADGTLQRYIIAVAAFNDVRSTTDRSAVGKRVKSDEIGRAHV